MFESWKVDDSGHSVWEIAVLLSSIDRTFSPSREDSLSSKRRDRERETFTIYCHDRSLKIKYPKYPKYRFVALDEIFFFFLFLFLKRSTMKFRGTKVFAERNTKFFSFWFYYFSRLQFLHDPGMPASSLHFPRKQDFPIGRVPVRALPRSQDGTRTMKKKYRWAIENLKISLKVELLSTFKE